MEGFYYDLDETIEPDDSGYECDVCGEPASFYNGDTDKFFCEEHN